MSLPDITGLTDRVFTSSEKFKRDTTPAFGSFTRICSIFGKSVRIAHG